jgi:hypothetical protein
MFTGQTYRLASDVSIGGIIRPQVMSSHRKNSSLVVICKRGDSHFSGT